MVALEALCGAGAFPVPGTIADGWLTSNQKLPGMRSLPRAPAKARGGGTLILVLPQADWISPPSDRRGLQTLVGCSATGRRLGFGPKLSSLTRRRTDAY